MLRGRASSGRRGLQSYLKAVSPWVSSPFNSQVPRQQEHCVPAPRPPCARPPPLPLPSCRPSTPPPSPDVSLSEHRSLTSVPRIRPVCPTAASSGPETRPPSGRASGQGTQPRAQAPPAWGRRHDNLPATLASPACPTLLLIGPP